MDREYRSRATKGANRVLSRAWFWFVSAGLFGCGSWFSAPSEWNQFLRFLFGGGVGLAVAALIYSAIWIWHLFGAINALPAEKRRADFWTAKEARKLVETTKKVMAKLDALDELEAKEKKRQLLPADEDVRDAAIPLLIKFECESKTIMLGEILLQLEIMAGSIGIQHHDIRHKGRELAGSFMWSDGIASLQMLVAKGVMKTADGSPFEQNSLCVLTDLGRKALRGYRQSPLREEDGGQSLLGGLL